MENTIQKVFKQAGIKQSEIVKASGRSVGIVSRVMRGMDRSRFIERAAYELLQERLGQQCPPFDEVFNRG